MVELYEIVNQFQALNGVPLANGRLYVYALGRSRLMNSWSDIDGTVLNPNPVILDNAGMAKVYVDPAFDYTIVVCDEYDNEIFSVDKYIVSASGYSVSGVAVGPSEHIGVSSYVQNNVVTYVPYLVGDVGHTYSGVAPIVVDNESDIISAQTASFGVESPLYLVKDDASATVIGVDHTAMENFLSGKADASALDEIRDNMMSATAIGGVNNIITGYNGSAFSAGSTYSGIAPITVDNENKTISVSSKELEAQAPLQITDVGSAYQISLTGTLDPGALIVDYGAGTYAEIQSAVSEGRPVIAHRNAGGRDYYASLEQGAYGTYYFNCDDGDTQYTFTVNTTDTWATSSTNSLTGVSHDGTLLGSGTQSDPLGISYPLNPSTNEATATFNQYGVSAQDSEGRTGYYGTTGVTLMSGTASEVVNVPSVRNWESTYDTVAVNSGLWGQGGGKTYTGISPVVVDNTADTIAVSAKSISVQTPLTFSETDNSFVFGISGTDKWDSTYDTVSVNSGSWGGVEPSASEAIDAVTANSGTWNTVTSKLDTTAFSTVSGDFITAHQSLPESATWNTVTAKLDTTAFSTVSGNFITAHQALPESANWNTVTSKLDKTAFDSYSGEVSDQIAYVSANAGKTYAAGANIDITNDTISGRDWTDDITGASAYAFNEATAATTAGLDYISGQVDSKLPTTAFSTVSGNFITALPDSANWNSTYNTVNVNSGSWSGRPQEPVSGINIDIFESAGTVVFSGMSGGGSVPEGVMVESGLEYNAVNEISGYSGSAFAQYGAEKQWLQHDDTLLHVANSAQYALGVNVSAVSQLMGVDETVLWSGNLSAVDNASLTASEDPLNFEFLDIYMNGFNDGLRATQVFRFVSTDKEYCLAPQAFQGLTQRLNHVRFQFNGTIGTCSSTIQYLVDTNGIRTASDRPGIIKIVGVGRKEV